MTARDWSLPEFTLRIPATRIESIDDDARDFITPARARLIRLDIETERAAAELAGETGGMRRESPAARYASPPCTFYSGATGATCGTAPARRFLCGWRCEVHQPPQPPTPDPSRTAAALRARYEQLVLAPRRTA